MLHQRFARAIVAALCLANSWVCEAGRSDESLVFDGLQGAYAPTQPASPGYAFITPARAAGTVPNWYEFSGSFTIDGWFRPSRLFLGTTIEGAIISCLVSDSVLLRYSGFGVTTTGLNMQGKLNFRVTQNTNQVSVSGTIFENVWQHFTAVYDIGGVCTTVGTVRTCTPATATLYLGLTKVGTASLPDAGAATFTPSNDLGLGRFNPTPTAAGTAAYFAGQLAEVRAWSRALTAGDVAYAAYAVYAPAAARADGMVAYWPMGRDLCTPAVCKFSSQQWVRTDQGTYVLGSSPSNSPKCLAVSVGGGTASRNGNLVQLNACGSDPPEFMRWIRSSYGTLQPTDSFYSCLAVSTSPPWDGAFAFLAPCLFEITPTNAYQRWSYNESTGQIQNVLSGLCLTAADNINAAGIFLIDCYDISPAAGSKPQLAVEVLNEHHGTLRGGSSFARRGDGSGCCAPIDTPPEIFQIGLTQINQGEPVPASATVDIPLTLNVYARDLNQNDGVVLTMVTPPSTGVIFLQLTNILTGPNPSNPVVYQFSWTPTYATQWTNPALAVFQAFDLPVNEFNPANAAGRQYSASATVTIATVTPPTFLSPTPADGQDFPAQFGIPVNFVVRVESRASINDIIGIVFSQDGSPSSNLSPPPAAQVKLGSDEATEVRLVTGGIQFRLNPTSRSFTFTALAADAGRQFSVCFIGQVEGKSGVAGRTPLRCVTLSVQTTRPIYTNGSTANNTRFYSYVGCQINFDISTGKNDSAATYTIRVAPRVTYYALLDGTRRADVGRLPAGAAFARAGPAAADGAGRYVFEWEPSKGQEGNWSVCLNLTDSLDINTVVRCMDMIIAKCRRCVQAGDTLQSVATHYDAHWLEIFTVNPQLYGYPDVLTASQLVNVGVMYLVKRNQTLKALANRLYTSPGAIMSLNPDIPGLNSSVSELDLICVLPPLCGPSCAGAATCDAEWKRPVVSLT